MSVFVLSLNGNFLFKPYTEDVEATMKCFNFSDLNVSNKLKVAMMFDFTYSSGASKLYLTPA